MGAAAQDAEPGIEGGEHGQSTQQEEEDDVGRPERGARVVRGKNEEQHGVQERLHGIVGAAQG